MAIRSEKRKVLQQIVNKNEPGLEADPEPLLTSVDLHWFDALNKKPATEESEKKDKPEEDSKQK